MFIENMIVMLFRASGIELSKLQKVLLIILVFEFVIVGMMALGRMVGHTFLWYTVQPWMVVAEGACSAVTVPFACRGIWKS